MVVCETDLKINKNSKHLFLIFVRVLLEVIGNIITSMDNIFKVTWKKINRNLTKNLSDSGIWKIDINLSLQIDWDMTETSSGLKQ